jgi:hypothetical protein
MTSSIRDNPEHWRQRAKEMRMHADGRSHPFQRHQPADVVGKVLQADFGFRPRDADRPYDPSTRRVLLSTEHVLDAGSNSALLAVRVLLRLR